MSTRRRRWLAENVSPRKEPRQPRARETVKKILDATASLLEEEGFEALTTNGIAARAEVNVASLYSYFPNKYAVITALALRSWEEGMGLFEDLLRLDDDETDWRDIVHQSIDLLAAHWRERPGFVGLLVASQAIPELREMNERSTSWLVERVTAWIQMGGLPGGLPRLRAMARVMVETSNGVIHSSLTQPAPEAERMLTELKLVLTSYLANFID